MDLIIQNNTLHQNTQEYSTELRNMKREDHLALTGFYSLVLLFLSTIAFTFLYPNYSHSEQSFSELGAIGAPNYIAFNVVSFGMVGLLSIIFVRNLRNTHKPEYSRGNYLSHLFAAISWIMTGVFPASFTNDLLYNIHVAWAFLTYVSGILCITMAIKFFGKIEGFTTFSLISVWLMFFVWGSILLSFSDTIITPEWGQLISIYSFFTWQGMFSLLIFRYENDVIDR